MSSDAAIETEIHAKGLTAPRVTPERIAAIISHEYYFTAHQAVGSGDEHPESLKLLTFCVLVLANGFTVTGESACASAKNFDQDLGRKIARKAAVDKIWPLEGYYLKWQIRLDEMAKEHAELPDPPVEPETPSPPEAERV